MAGYSSAPSPNMASTSNNGLGLPVVWSLEHGQLPDDGTVNQVTLPVNTNERIDYMVRSATDAACIHGHRRPPKKLDG